MPPASLYYLQMGSSKSFWARARHDRRVTGFFNMGQMQLKNMEKQNVSNEWLSGNFLGMLNEAERHLVDQQSSLSEFEKNEPVYKEGQVADRIFIVKRGRVKIVTTGEEEKEVLKALVLPGEIFGEGAMFGDSHRNDTAMAMDEGVSLIEIRSSQARALLQSNPELAFKVTAQIAQKLRTAEKRLEALTFKNSRTRIIEFLKDTARRQGRKIGYETLLHPFLTHQDIGNLTTTSRQTVSSVLNELKGSNKIYYDRHRLLIRDLSVL
jgi:CRP/FNR family cyclic AMP-dependent transcriptional regulator